MNLNRELFKDILMDSSRRLAEKQGRDIIYAAPLANLVQNQLRKA
jgi:hypothetical protein